MARALELETSRLHQPDCYFSELAQTTERKRDEMAEVLREVGMEPILPDAGYFMVADTAPLGKGSPLSGVYAYSWKLLSNRSVAPLGKGSPLSGVYAYSWKLLSNRSVYSSSG